MSKPETYTRHDECGVDTVHLAALEPVRIGMPELCRAGLSETWLWKACGHRHWLALAAAYGLERPDFRDEHGNRLYPAFSDIRLVDGRLDAVAEHGVINFDVTLERVGHTRFRSSIMVRSRTALIAHLIMESAFVRRAIAGHNQSATRSRVARPCRLLPSSSPTPPFRLTNWCEAQGFREQDRADIASLALDPSPHEDFNGADFLYFAAFQAMIDRAEWSWFRRTALLQTTSHRHIVYVGNVELGDRVRATLCGWRDEDRRLATWIELSRESDRAPIALAFTDRRCCERHAPGRIMR